MLLLFVSISEIHFFYACASQNTKIPRCLLRFYLDPNANR